MSGELTVKQRAARAYYVKNAERIKANRKAQRISGRSATSKVQSFNLGLSSIATPKVAAVVEDKERRALPAKPAAKAVSAREVIENMRIDRELGLLGGDGL